MGKKTSQIISLKTTPYYFLLKQRETEEQACDNTTREEATQDSAGASGETAEFVTNQPETRKAKAEQCAAVTACPEATGSQLALAEIHTTHIEEEDEDQAEIQVDEEQLLIKTNKEERRTRAKII